MTFRLTGWNRRVHDHAKIHGADVRSFDEGPTPTTPTLHADAEDNVQALKST